MSMGELCAHSEDWFVTNPVLRDGYSVKYVAAAKKYLRAVYYEEQDVVGPVAIRSSYAYVLRM